MPHYASRTDPSGSRVGTRSGPRELSSKVAILTFLEMGMKTSMEKEIRRDHSYYMDFQPCMPMPRFYTIYTSQDLIWSRASLMWSFTMRMF